MVDHLWLREMQKCTRIVRDEEDAFIRRHCINKVRHATAEGAEREATRLSMKFYDKASLKHYHCEICDGFHVGRKYEHK